jgi:hypothetical protein
VAVRRRRDAAPQHDIARGRRHRRLHQRAPDRGRARLARRDLGRRHASRVHRTEPRPHPAAPAVFPDRVPRHPHGRAVADVARGGRSEAAPGAADRLAFHHRGRRVGSDASSPPKYATTACACPVRSGTATRATTSSSSPRSCTAVTYCVSCAASSAGACGTRSNTSSASKGSRPTNRTATLSPATPRGCCYDRDPMSTNGTDLMRVHPRDRRLLPHGRGRDGNRPHHGLCGSSVQALDVAAYMVGGSGIRQRQSPVGVQRAPGRSSMGAADQLESHPGATRRERGGPAGVVRGTAGVARPASSLTAAEAGCWC